MIGSFRNNFFFAICIGLMVHLLVQCLIDNRPLQHAAEGTYISTDDISPTHM